MEDRKWLEEALGQTVDRLTGPGCPPRVAAAIRQAVLHGGGRLRPRLCRAVFDAAGGSRENLIAPVAAAIELIHCASLVHDDLPCFDNALLRRGVPSVHAAHGEALAVLAGDALILGAFDCLAALGETAPTLVAPLTRLLARAAGLPRGMTAGQAWESEPQIDLESYHRAKTASLFAAATMSGALLAGDDPERWRPLGLGLGQIYQILDDIRDLTGEAEELGKPTGRDAALHRPNAARALGLQTCRELLRHRERELLQGLPPAPGVAALRRFLEELLDRLIQRVDHGAAPPRVASMEGAR